MSSKMKRYSILSLILLILAIGSTSCTKNNLLQMPSCPDCNVILILVDTLRADHVGAYGYHRNTTPNIDKLAEEGILFKNALAQSSWTKPSTVSILTGLYPKNHQALYYHDFIADEIVFLPEMLKERGYKTAAFVSNVNLKEEFNFNQGVDKFFYFETNWTNQNIHPSSDEMNELIIPYIRNQSVRTNNFIYVHYMNPHTPYVPQEKIFSLENDLNFTLDFFIDQKIFLAEKGKKPEFLKQMINAYDDEIRWNDYSIGKIFKTLKENKMYENSIIIIVADHGEEFMEHGKIQHGETLFQEQLHVPLIIKIPEVKPRIIDKRVAQIDVMPTILNLLNISVQKKIDGQDLFDSEERELHFAELDLMGRMIYSVQDKKDKFIKTSLKNSEGSDLGTFRWFRRSANFRFKKSSIKIPISSFHKDRELIIKLNGKKIKEVKVGTDIKNLSLDLPLLIKNSLFTPVREIEIISKTHCEKPIDVIKTLDLRCFSFRIFNSSELDVSKINGFEEQFYVLESNEPDREDLEFLISDRKRSLLKNYLEDYLSNISKIVEGNESFELNKDELEQLRALGYLN